MIRRLAFAAFVAVSVASLEGAASLSNRNDVQNSLYCVRHDPFFAILGKVRYQFLLRLICRMFLDSSIYGCLRNSEADWLTPSEFVFQMLNIRFSTMLH